MIKKAISLVFFFFLTAIPSCAMELAGLDQPESVVIDPDTNNLYVSNVNGSPLAKDRNGYISKISGDGMVVVMRFISSDGDIVLHAPKGMVIEDSKLYVTDIDTVKVFDLVSGRLQSEIGFGNFDPIFLNDIASDRNGKLFISDMSKDCVYRLDTANNNEISIFKEDEELAGPNGLFVVPKTGALLVASSRGHKLIEISQEGDLKVLRSDMGIGLDGIAADLHKRDIYVSSFDKGEIYKISDWGEGELELFMAGLTSPADIFFDNKGSNILVPHMKANTLLSYSTDN